MRLTPPPPPIERPRSTPAPVTRELPLAPPKAPTQPSIAPATIAPTTGVTPTLAPTTTPAARDTASGTAGRAPAIPLGPLPLNRSGTDSAMGPPAGAAAREAGVTIGSRVPNTAAYRDSMLKGKLQTAPYLASKYAPTGEMLATLKESQRAALGTYRRNTTAGSSEVHVPQGEGMNGEGAVGGGAGVQGNGLHAGSGFGLPFLSKGPSRRPAEEERGDRRRLSRPPSSPRGSYASETRLGSSRLASPRFTRQAPSVAPRPFAVLHAWSSARYTFPLPAGHRFPIEKYALLRERVLAEGIVSPEAMHEPERASREDLLLVHTADYVDRFTQRPAFA